MDTIHQGNSRRGFFFIELIIVIAVLALLAGMLLPSLTRAKSRTIRIQCMNNLKQDAIGFLLWAGDNNEHFPMSVPVAKGGAQEAIASGETFRIFQCMSNELNTTKVLVCPADTRPSAANFDSLQNANVSYFVGADVDETTPRMFLEGDRNMVVNGIPAIGGLVTVKSTDMISWTGSMHRGEGNVGRGDGSVGGYTSANLQNALQDCGTNQQRLAFP